jgi:hypothetical protein
LHRQAFGKRDKDPTGPTRTEQYYVKKKITNLEENNRRISISPFDRSSKRLKKKRFVFIPHPEMETGGE